MTNTILITIYLLGFLIGYLFILYLEANDKMNGIGDKDIALFILLFWPFSIPFFVAGIILIIPIFLMANLFEKIETQLLILFKKKK